MPDYTEAPANFASEAIVNTDEAAAGLQKAIAAGQVRTEWDEDLRVFVAPNEPTTRFLVKAGKVISFPSEHSPTGRRDMDRDGDIWAVFAGSICATRDEEVIAWCEAHSGNKELHIAYHEEDDVARKRRVGTGARECEVDVGLCRDADQEATPAWAEMKALQVATSRRSAQLPISMDLDKLFDRLTPAVGKGPASDRVENATTAARRADRERTRGR